MSQHQKFLKIGIVYWDIDSWLVYLINTKNEVVDSRIMKDDWFSDKYQSRGGIEDTAYFIPNNWESFLAVYSTCPNLND